MAYDPVAFIGLGIMGAPMAGHLLAAGCELHVHTRTKSKAEPLLSRGAKWCDTPAEAAAEATHVFLCLPDTPDVERVVTGTDGVLAGAIRNITIIDHSTIAPAATRALATAAAERGVTFLDAPVSGGDVGARNATLSIMVGGDEQRFNAVRRLLEKLGKTITHCGPSGAGQLTKLVNQILVTGNLLAACESLAFAKRNGLDLDKTIAAIGGGAAGSWQLANLGPRMVKGDFAPGFMIDLVVKDLRLVAEALRDPKLDLPAQALVHHLFLQAQRTGHGRDGTQALFAVVEQLAGK
jgi:3-hydroxyisobutyrate dehydrogenase-like beta-hydroxyacid dehydrogenase